MEISYALTYNLKPDINCCRCDIVRIRSLWHPV